MFNLNVPSCTTGTVKAQVEVPTAKDAEGRDLLTVDCTTPLANPKDDIDAFIHGYPALSPLSLTPASG